MVEGPAHLLTPPIDLSQAFNIRFVSTPTVVDDGTEAMLSPVLDGHERANERRRALQQELAEAEPVSMPFLDLPAAWGSDSQSA